MTFRGKTAGPSSRRRMWLSTYLLAFKALLAGRDLSLSETESLSIVNRWDRDGTGIKDACTNIMRVIQANCRIQFTADDIDFILNILGRKKGEEALLTTLLTDSECRDLILDDERLYRALLEQQGCLRVSAHLYFYVLVRHVLRRAGLEDRNVADYVAEMLTELFPAGADAMRCSRPAGPSALLF